MASNKTKPGTVKKTAAGKSVTAKSKRKSTRTATTSKRARKGAPRTAARTRSKRTAAAAGVAAAAGDTAALSTAPPSHILVFVPGFLGSKLRDKRTKKTVWLDFSTVPLNPFEWEGWLDNLFEDMLYPNPNLEPAGLVDDVLFLPPWIKQEQYSRLLKTFKDWGYEVDPSDPNANELNAYTFSYDWRQDQRISARLLGERLKELRALHPGKQVWLMGHSGGGIISRWLIEKEGGDKLVDRLFLLASPWDGSPLAVYMLFQGMDTLLRFKFNAFGIPERTRAALRSFPAIYQLIPQARGFLKSKTGEQVDPFLGSSWLDDERDLKLLEDGRRFNKDLGNHLSIPDTIVFLGRKLTTTIGGVMSFGQGLRWQGIEWSDQALGDGTLPEYSAFFPEARVNVPVVADHGEIYISPALTDLLRVELIDKFIKLQTQTIESKNPKTLATLTMNRELYVPGERIEIQIQLRTAKGDKPVKKATLAARVKWLQGLPGTADLGEPAELPALKVLGNPEQAGVYHANFNAPSQEGYYQLETRIKIPRQAEVVLQDMFVIEQA